MNFQPCYYVVLICWEIFLKIEFLKCCYQEVSTAVYMAGEEKSPQPMKGSPV